MLEPGCQLAVQNFHFLTFPLLLAMINNNSQEKQKNTPNHQGEGKELYNLVRSKKGTETLGSIMYLLLFWLLVSFRVPLLFWSQLPMYGNSRQTAA